MTTFPLCEKAGFKPCKQNEHFNGVVPYDFIPAYQVERFLADAPVVSGWYVEKEKRWTSGSTTQPTDTHTARLVCVEKVVRESEERQLLREMAALNETITNEWIRAISAKAKALLERK